MTTFIGIDPGVSGGIAVIFGNGGVDAFKMPDTPQAVAQLIREHRTDRTWAYLERVASSPQMGVVSAFTFGRGWGVIQGVLAALEIPYDLVTPTVWQKSMGCLTKGDKNKSKAKAAAMFPTIKVTHAVADALLLAEYCRRMRGTDAA